MIEKQYHTTTGNQIKIQKREVYRYLGYAKITEDERVEELVNLCLGELVGQAMPKSMYEIYPIVSQAGAKLNLEFVQVESQALAKNLAGCESIMVFAATLGPKVDMLIQKYSRMDPLKGVIMQAAGAMLIESYCDERNEILRQEMRESGYELRPRFSPGYGDLSLEHQRDIFRVLSCERTLGLTLMDSLIMAPSKSVTAFIGMKKRNKTDQAYEKISGVKDKTVTEKCAACDNVDCAFRTL